MHRCSFLSTDKNTLLPLEARAPLAQDIGRLESTSLSQSLDGMAVAPCAVSVSCPRDEEGIPPSPTR